MTGDDELIDRLRRTLFAEADAITPRREPLGEAPTLRALPGGARRRHGRLPWMAMAAAAAAAAIAVAVLEWPGSQQPARVGILPAGPGTSAPARATATTIPASPTTTLRSAGTPSHTVQPPLPAGFEPTSVTFVDHRDGWVAGTYPCGMGFCVAVARTYDGGGSWIAVGSPPVGVLGAGGVEALPSAASLRFADADDGWLYSRDGQSQHLWSTHDGGLTWSLVSLPVQDAQISSLEAASGSVYAAVLDFSDSSVHVESSPVSRDSWTDASTGVPLGAGPVASVQLVLQGGSGWLIEDDRTVVGGARLSGGQWVPWTPPCKGGNGPAFLAAPTAQAVDAVCELGAWGPPAAPPPRATIPSTWLYASGNGGSGFAPDGRMPISGGALLTGATPQTLVASGAFGAPTAAPQREGLILSSDAGGTWRTVYVAPPNESVLYLGFTTTSQGVAIVGGGASTELLMTYDAGQSWAPVAF